MAKLLQLCRDLLANKPGAESELVDHDRDTGGNNFASNDEMRLGGQDKWEALNIGELAKHAAKEIDK